MWPLPRPDQADFSPSSSTDFLEENPGFVIVRELRGEKCCSADYLADPEMVGLVPSITPPFTNPTVLNDRHQVVKRKQYDLHVGAHREPCDPSDRSAEDRVPVRLKNEGVEVPVAHMVANQFPAPL